MMMLELNQYFFFQIILNTISTIFKFFSTSKVVSVHRLPKPHLSITVSDEYCILLRRDDVELLMEDLGVFFHRGGGVKLPEVLNSSYVYGVFEAEEPRLEEVKEAFDVFDENKDGFIDAKELQRVLCVLGLKERVEVEDCRKMIRAFDENADGRIDFNEFVKLMENSFC